MLLLLGCAPTGGGGALSDVVSLRVDPPALVLPTSEAAGGTATFVAYATDADGVEAPLDLVSWSTSNVSAGTIDGAGLFQASTTNGGATTIEAAHQALTASASLVVVYTEEVLDGVDDAVPAAFAAAAPVADPASVLRYPAAGVTVPRNLEGFAFAWEAAEGRVWRLRFRSEITDVSVYTTASPWVSTAALWEVVAAANRDGEVEVTLSSGVWSGGELTDVREGPPATLRVHRLDARGSVLYWQTTAQSIMRVPLGATEATRFFPTSAEGRCYGCHVVSEPIQHMVVTHDGVNGMFSVVDVADTKAPAVVTGPVDGNSAEFKTLSPDGTRMVAVANGRARLYSLPDGALLRELDTGGQNVSHPDWSPDGGTILFVRPTGIWLSGLEFERGEIVSYPFDGETLGAPTVLVTAAEWNNYYPAFSPDGRWVAFNRSKGNAYADEDAELWLMRPDGTGLVRLDAANGEGAQTNSFPRWAPLPDDDVLWLAFSSSRPYEGDALGDLPQIWITAVDEALAEEGVDPSAPPFWMPGQDPTSNNHLPVWWSR